MTPPYPKRWIIEVSRSCNLHCMMCRESNDKYPQMLMDMSLLDKLAPFLKEAEAILPFGWGEPLMHPKFKNILRTIRDINSQAQIVFNTNGQLMLSSLIETIIETKVNIVCFSIDSILPSLYETIRRGARFDRVIETIETLNDLKRKKNSPLPHLFMEIVLMKQNIGELEDIATFLKRYRFSGVLLEEVRPSAVDKQTLETLKIHKIKKHHNVIKRFSERLAKNNVLLGGPIGSAYARSDPGSPVNKIGKMYPSMDQLTCDEKHPSVCRQPWFNVFVSYDGNCSPCCMNSSFQIGNLSNSNFDAIWNGEKMAALRNALIRKKYSRQCKQCIQEQRHHC